MPNLVVEWIREYREKIPFPLYCTRLDGGKFEFVNQALADFLHRGVEEFSHEHFTAEELYYVGKHRRDFVSKVSARSSQVVISCARFLLGKEGPANSQLTRWAIDIARAFEDDEQDDALVVGILTDVPDDWEEPPLARNRIKAFQAILNMIDVGAHTTIRDLLPHAPFDMLVL